MNTALLKIKKKFNDVNPNRYWGDDFDVRYYLVSKLKKLENKLVLDIGGGIGIISSEITENNKIVNLDLSIDDLKLCNRNYNNISVTNGSMINLPFKNNSFDCIVCSHLLEIAKELDVKNNISFKDNIVQYPTIEKTLEEMKRILKENGVIYITTPNNLYYKTSKLSYSELKHALNQIFKKYTLYFFNTYPSVNKKYRKLNFSNSIPKLKLKFTEHDKIIQSLIKKDKGVEQKSISFYVEVSK